MCFLLGMSPQSVLTFGALSEGLIQTTSLIQHGEKVPTERCCPPCLPALPASRALWTALCTASPRGGQQDPRCEQAGITAALGLTLPFAACLCPPRVTRLLSAVGPMPAAPPLAKHVEVSEGWAVSINSDYIVFDDNMVMHIQILVKNTHRPDLMKAVSTDAGQNCLLELAG